MAILDVVQYPGAVLARKASPVTAIQSRVIQQQIDDMIETLHTLPGIGLAAPQIGQSNRIFVFDLSRQPGEVTPYQGPHVVINPEILKMEGEAVMDEGCLSVSGYRAQVKRASFVLLSGSDRAGKTIELTGEGLVARLFQHEVDHLNGLLLIDRLSTLKKDIFLRRFKKELKKGG